MARYKRILLTHLLRLSCIQQFKEEIHKRICQGFHEITCHGAQLLQIQLQTGKLSCCSEPDFMMCALALQIVSVKSSMPSSQAEW